MPNTASSIWKKTQIKCMPAKKDPINYTNKLCINIKVGCEDATNTNKYIGYVIFSQGKLIS